MFENAIHKMVARLLTTKAIVKYLENVSRCSMASRTHFAQFHNHERNMNSHHFKNHAAVKTMGYPGQIGAE